MIQKIELHEAQLPAGYSYKETILPFHREFPKNFWVEWEVYKCDDPDKHYWDVSKLIIKTKDKVLGTFYRNYRPGPVAYAVWEGKEFLITSLDYQCITIINLTDGCTVENYCAGDYSKGCGFCPTYITYDEEYEELDIEGCFWGGPYEHMVLRGVQFNPLRFAAVEFYSDDEDEYEDEEDEEDDSDE